MVRCRTMRRWRWAKSATSERWTRWRDCSGRAPRTAQPSVAAAICLLGVNCALARGLPDRDAQVRAIRNRVPGASARRSDGSWPRSASAARPRPPRRCSTWASRRAIRRVRRSRWRSRPSPFATRPLLLKSSRRIRTRPPRWLSWRRLRHARRRSRQGAVFRVRAADLLGAPAEGSPTKALMQALIRKLDF